MARNPGARGLVPVILIMLLSACGGGSDGSPSPQPQNQPPVAVIAGPVKGAVFAGSPVVLDASQALDNDGSVSGVLWELASGPEEVQITDPAATILEFTAPEVTEDTELVFLLTVTDDDGATSTAEIRILVHAQVPGNASPSAQVLSDLTVQVGADVELDARTSLDTDGTITAYSWVQTGGLPVILGDATSAVATFKAPDAPGTLQFRVVVTDDRGATDSDIVNVRVVPASANQPPQANIVALANPVTEGAAFTLDGSTSVDETGLTFAWTVPAGFTIEGDTAQTSRLQLTGTPDVVADTSYTFILVVSDGQFTSHASTTVIVKAFNRAPEVTITTEPPGIAQSGVNEGASVKLAAKTSDLDGHQVNITWKQLDGAPIALPAGNELVFTAPDVGPAGDRYEFEVTAKDEEGATDSKTIAFNVNFVNRIPVAVLDASAAEAGEGTTITLSAVNSSDPDQQPLAFTFEQIDLGNGMPPAMIENTGDGTATVTLPGIGPELDRRPLGLRVVVDDQHGAANSKAVADTQVIVRFVNRLPQLRTISATPDSVNEGVLAPAVKLTVDAFDPDDQALSYAWQVPDGFSATGKSTSELTVTETPNVGTSGQHLFSVNVRDGSGVSTFTVPLAVQFVNQRPEAVAGPTVEIPEDADLAVEEFFLDGRGSSDGDVTDGHQTLQYRWLIPAGSGLALDDVESARPRIVAIPDVSTNRDIEVTLEISDGIVSETSETTVHVRYVNEPPVVDGISGDAEVEEGNPFALTASARDDLGVARYRWTVPTNFVIDPATREAPVLRITGTPDVTPENAAAGITAEFSVVAIDEAGAESAPSSHSMTITYRNQLPVIASVDGDSRVNARTNGHRLQANGSDGDGQSLSYTWTRIDTVADVTDIGVTLPFTGQELVFNAPDVTTDETIVFRVIASDGMNESEPFDFSVTIDKDQDAPEVDAITPAEPSLAEGDGHAFSIAVTATDNLDTNLDYDWEPHPDFTTHVDPATPNVLIIDATPNVGPDGEGYPFSVRISDDDGNAVDHAFTVRVEFVNQQPEINSVDVPATAPEGSIVTMTVDAHDNDELQGQVLAYQWNQITEADLSDFAVGADGTATFTAPPVEEGGINVTFTVTANDQSGTANATRTSEARTVHIDFVNQSPVIDSVTGVTSIEEGNGFTLIVNGSDGDAGQTLSYEWTVPDGFTFNADSANDQALVVSGTPGVGPDGSSYGFTVRARDDSGVAESEYSLPHEHTVNVTFVNRQPVIDSVTPAAHTVAEGDLDGITFEVAAHDDDLTPLSYTWLLPDGFTDEMVDGAGTSELTILRTPDVTGTVTYQFAVQVSDDHGGVAVREEIPFTVNFVNQQPEILSVSAQSPVDEGQQDVELRVTAQDGDEHALTYTWTQRAGETPAVGMITVNPETGTGTFDAPDQESTLHFTVTVDDSNGGVVTSEDEVAVVVNRVNDAPSVVVDRATVTVPEGEIGGEGLTFTVTANDDAPPAEGFLYQWDDLDGFTFSGDTTDTLTITATPNVTTADGVTYTPSVTVNDREGGVTTVRFEINVEFVNQPPTVDISAPDGLADGNVDEGTTITLIAVGQDLDNDTIEYVWQQTGGATDLGISDRTDAQVTFTPNVTGGDESFTVQVTASDEHGGTDIASISFTVVDLGDTPTVSIVPTPAGLVADGVMSGFPVTLQTATQDMTGEITYLWSQTEGVTGADLGIDGRTTPEIMFNAPDIASDTPVPVTVQVTAVAGGGSDSEEISFMVRRRPDNMPLPFHFTDLDRAPAHQSGSMTFASNEIIVEGLATGVEAPISVTGGTYTVNGVPGVATVANDARVVVHVAGSTTAGVTNEATVSIGGVEDTFSVTTIDPRFDVQMGFGRNMVTWESLQGLKKLRLSRSAPDPISISTTVVAEFDDAATGASDHEDVLEDRMWQLNWASGPYLLQGQSLASSLVTLKGGLYTLNNARSVDAIGYFKSPEPEESGMFGGAVALDAAGDLMVVGAPDEDFSSGGEGLVHVFRRDENGWAHVQTLNGLNIGDGFGTTLALSGTGDVLVVGSPSATIGADLDAKVAAGEVHIFRRNVAGEFQLDATLRSDSTAQAGERFGTSLALSNDGNLLAVGVPFDQSAGSNPITGPGEASSPGAGAVYVYRFAGSWSRNAYLKEATPVEDNRFGTAVALGAGDRLFVSRLGAARAVFVYEPDGAGWNSPLQLDAPAGAAVNHGETLSAAQIVPEGGFYFPLFVTGSHAYELRSGAWTPAALPIAGAGTPVSIAVSRGVTAGASFSPYIAIGFDETTRGNSGIYMSTSLPTSSIRSGSVYVYMNSGFSWQVRRVFKAPNPGEGDAFGRCLSIDEDARHIAVCAPGEDSAGADVHPAGMREDNSLPDSGAAYLY